MTIVETRTQITGGVDTHLHFHVAAAVFRVLQVARRSAVDERIQILNQMRNLCFCAEDEIRERFEGLSPAALINEAASMRPRKSDPDRVRFTTLIVLRELAQRARTLRQETVRHNQLL